MRSSPVEDDEEGVIALLVGPDRRRIDISVGLLRRSSSVLAPALDMSMERLDGGVRCLSLPHDDADDWRTAATFLCRRWQGELGMLRIAGQLALARKYVMPAVEDAACVYGLDALAVQGPVSVDRIAGWARLAREGDLLHAMHCCERLMAVQLARFESGRSALPALELIDEMGWRGLLRPAARLALAESDGMMQRVPRLGREALAACLVEALNGHCGPVKNRGRGRPAGARQM